MPRIEGMYQEHRADGLVVLGVAVQDSREAVVAFADEVGATYPIVIDADGQVAAEYGALALPVQYWIDPHGIVRDWAFGELPPDLLAASLQRILVP
jgi:peroxiredoxin